MEKELENLQKDLVIKCRNNSHDEPLLFLGYNKDIYEGRTTMTVIDGKEYFPSYFSFQWTQVKDK